jgi:hypothetical protein
VLDEFSHSHATKATPSRLTAEQGRYSAAAATAKAPAARCARRGEGQRCVLLSRSGRLHAEQLNLGWRVCCEWPRVQGWFGMSLRLKT